MPSTPNPKPEPARSAPSSPPRLLRTGPLPGALNMALDEHLLRTAAGPVVRLYEWSPPTLSLGYGQRSDDVDRDACARLGVDVTRRLTGGRAVLHHQELTYSVCVASELLGVGRNITQAYALLSGCLIDALARLGLVASFTERPRQLAHPGDPACFATSLGGDLAVDGRKLIGSAQCHRFGGVLQHGSIPITVDESLLAAILHRPTPTRGWTCLAELGVAPDRDAWAAALAAGFAPLFGAEPEVGEPTAEEWAAARELAGKYAGEAWVYRI